MSETKRPLISQGVDDFLKYIRDTTQNYHMAVADEQQANNETQDILHAIELNTSNWKPAQLLRTLRRVREKRRAAKDTIAAAKPLMEWYEENEKAIKRLERLLGDIRKQESKIRNRVYVPRTGVVDEPEGDGGESKG